MYSTCCSGYRSARRLHPAPLLQLQYFRGRVKLQQPPSVALFRRGSSCQ
jgi:hypothetical protein